MFVEPKRAYYVTIFLNIPEFSFIADGYYEYMLVRDFYEPLFSDGEYLEFQMDDVTITECINIVNNEQICDDGFRLSCDHVINTSYIELLNMSFPITDIVRSELYDYFNYNYSISATTEPINTVCMQSFLLYHDMEYYFTKEFHQIILMLSMLKDRYAYAELGYCKVGDDSITDYVLDENYQAYLVLLSLYGWNVSNKYKFTWIWDD